MNKRSVSLEADTVDYAAELVARGDYPSISAAIVGEVAVARALREDGSAELVGRLRERLSLPPEAWAEVASLDDLMRSALSHIDQLEREAGADRR